MTRRVLRSAVIAGLANLIAVLSVLAADGSAPRAVTADRFGRLETLTPDSTAWPSAPLRWMNLEPHSPYFLIGARPTAHPRTGMSGLSLQPGEFTLIRLPAEAWLRLYDPDRNLCPGEYEVAVGNGSGLYAAQMPIKPDDAHSLLWEDRYGEERVLRITRLRACGGARHVALYRSDTGAIEPDTTYRERIALGGETIRARGADDATHLDFDMLRADVRLPLNLEGPLRLAVQTRRVYPDARGPDNVDSYRLRLRKPGEGAASPVVHELRFDTTPELHDPQSLDGCLLPTGRLETRYLDLAPGPHRLLIESTADVLVRVVSGDAAQFLLPALNRPQAPDQAKHGADATRLVEDAEAMRLDNTYREGALRAAQSLMKSDGDDERAQDLRAVGRSLWNRHTYYRSVLPYRGGAAHDPSRVWVMTSDLSPMLDHSRRSTAQPRQFEALLKALDEAWFLPLAAGAPTGPERAQRETCCAPPLAAALKLAPTVSPVDELMQAADVRGTLLAAAGRPALRGPALDLALTREWRRDLPPNEGALQEFWLPERGADSRLRLLADLGAKPIARMLWVQFDAAPAIRVHVSAQRQQAPWGVDAGNADAALSLLAEASGSMDALRFWGRLVAGRGVAPLLRPAEVELPLAADVRRVRVWAQNLPPADFRIAVQYRTSKPFEMNEEEHLLALDHAAPGAPYAAFLDLLRAAAPSGLPGAKPTPTYAIEVARLPTREAALADSVRWGQAGWSRQLRLEIAADRSEQHRVLVGAFAQRSQAEAALPRLAMPRASVVELPADVDSAVRAALARMPAAQGDAELLLQHWTPLLRLLQDRVARFSAPVRADAVPAPAAGSSAGASLAQAREDAGAGRWLNALEGYSSARRQGDAAARREAALGQVRSLRALGESALADQQLRAAALHDADPELRAAARSELLAAYRASGDDASEQGLLATALLRDGRAADAAALVESLQESGETQHALSLGLLLAACERPRENLLRAAYELRQWVVFERLLAQSAADRRALWEGLRAQLFGDDERALDYWRAAGEEGAAASAALREGQAIADALRSSRESTRREGAVKWIAWQAREPGPRRWRFAPDTVVAHAGMRSQEAVARDLLVTAFDARPDRPVRMQVFGPGVLRVETRPLFSDADEAVSQPYEGWIQVEQRHDGRVSRRVLPVSHNAPVAGFVRLAPGQAAIGQREEFAIDLAPGLNEIAVSAENRALLVRPYALDAIAPLVVLPPVATQTLAAALAGGNETTATSTVLRPGQLRIADGCGRGFASAERRDRSGFTGAEQGRKVGNVIENTLAVCGAAPPPRDTALRLPRPADLAPQGGSQDAESRLITTLWQAEHDASTEREAMLAQAESLARDLAGQPAADAVQARLRARGEWERIVSSRRDAGQRRLVEDAGRSHSPQSRSRMALLPALGAGEQLLRAGESVTVELGQGAATTLDVELAVQELPHAVSVPMTVSLRAGSVEPRRIELGGSGPKRLRFDQPLSTGSGSISFAVESAYANQFLRIALRERGAAGARPLAVESEREYFLATPARPLELELSGPAWLRLDERRGERLLTSYRYVAPGAQTVRFAPSAGQAEAQYQVYRRRPRSGTEPPTPVRASPVTVAGTWSAGLSPVVANLPRVVDAYPLSGWLGQEDATYSLSLTPTFRRNGDEGRGEVSERFVEFNLARRHYDEVREQYWHSDLRVRERDRGEPLFGLRQWFDYVPQRRPWSLSLFGSVHTQDLQVTDRRATSALLRADGAWRETLGDFWRNSTQFGVFHHLIDGESQREPAAEVDRDIAGRYKRQHRHGLTLSDRLTFTPFRDSELFGEVGLGSNEDYSPFDPDYLRYGVGARQALGACSVEGDYRLRHFMADEDRARSQALDYVDLAFDCDAWTRRASTNSAGHRLFARLSAAQELDSGDTGWFLSLGVDFSNGRGYRDFRPGEIDFRALRARGLADGFLNNRLGTERP